MFKLEIKIIALKHKFLSTRNPLKMFINLLSKVYLNLFLGYLEDILFIFYICRIVQIYSIITALPH